MQLAKRKTVSALAALLSFAYLLYRWSVSRRNKKGLRTSSSNGVANAITLAPQKVVSSSTASALQGKPLESQIARALAWHQTGLRGGIFLGKDSGISVSSGPQSPWLSVAIGFLSRLDRKGEAALAACCASLLVLFTALCAPGWALPVVVTLGALLLGCVTARASAMLQFGEDVGRSTLVDTVLELYSALARSSDSGFLLRATAKVPCEVSDALWKSLVAKHGQRKGQVGGSNGLHGFAVRDGRKVFVEVDAAAATRAASTRGTSAGGLRGAFILEPAGPKAVVVHHYSAAPVRLRGPAAAAAAAAPLRAALAEGQSQAIVPEARTAASDTDGIILPLAQESLERAALLCDEAEGGWEDEGKTGAMRLSTKRVQGTRFPMVRGIVEVPRAGHGGDGGGERAATLIFGVSCSLMAHQLVDPTKGDDTLLHWCGAGSNAWLSHMAWKGNALMSAKDGVFVHSVRRQYAEDSASTRFTSCVVPAPEKVAELHAAKAQAARAGRVFKPQRLLISVVDVLVRTDGSSRVCCVIHADPEVSALTPSSMVRSALLTAPCRGLNYVDMASNLQLPSPLKLQALEAQEDVKEIQVDGRTVVVSRCLADVLVDRSNDGPTPQ